MTFHGPSRNSLVSHPSASLAWMMTCKPEDSRGGLFLFDVLNGNSSEFVAMYPADTQGDSDG